MERDSVLILGMDAATEKAVTDRVGQQAHVFASEALSLEGVPRDRKPTVAVVRVDDGAGSDAFELVEELAGDGCRVVVVGSSKDPDLILRTMRAGACEFLLPTEQARIESAVEALMQASGALKLGTIASVFPAKGGMGATSIATNLAGSLHRQGRRTVLVDLDLEMGDVTSFLDLQGSYGIADVLSNIRRLDRNLLETSLPRHRSGVWVVSQSEKVEEADRVDPAGVTALLRFLRQHFDNVVVDGLRSFGDLPLAALDASDRVLLVVTQEVPAVRSAQRCAEIFRKLGYDGQRLTLVVNRFLRGSPITREVVEETVGLPVGATIANDFQTLTRSINQGVLLGDVAPRAALARDIDAIATTMATTAVRSGPRGSTGSFLRKIFAPRVIHGAQ